VIEVNYLWSADPLVLRFFWPLNFLFHQLKRDHNSYMANATDKKAIIFIKISIKYNLCKRMLVWSLAQTRKLFAQLYGQTIVNSPKRKLPPPLGACR
jgi:hypothetical protein